jgi:hypothetical protein
LHVAEVVLIQQESQCLFQSNALQTGGYWCVFRVQLDFIQRVPIDFDGNVVIIAQVFHDLIQWHLGELDLRWPIERNFERRRLCCRVSHFMRWPFARTDSLLGAVLRPASIGKFSGRRRAKRIVASRRSFARCRSLGWSGRERILSSRRCIARSRGLGRRRAKRVVARRLSARR